LVPLVTLIAALVGLCAAAIAAWVNANATFLITERRAVLSHFEAVREQLGRLLASRNAISIEGYPDLTPEDLSAVRRASYARFFERYTDETFAARATLAGLQTKNPVIRSVIESEEVQISPDQITRLWVALDQEESVALQELHRWWLRSPTRSGRRS
jgi:hypothetical protein